MNDVTPEQNNSLVWSAVQAIAISPEKANRLAEQYKASARKSNPDFSESQVEQIVASKLINEYARYTMWTGGASALPGVLPGVGTIVAAAGGGLADASLCLKAQVDMTMILAANFGWDMTEQNARYMAMLIAVSGGLEKLGVKSAAPVASKAGVRMLRQYLTGATLTTVKEMFKAFGVTFTRTALEKSLPFGIGIVLGGGLNYGLTQYVGWEAVKCFSIERDMRLRDEA